MDKLGSPHIFQTADDGGVVGEATWGEIFRGLEKTRVKGIMSLIICIIFILGMLWLFSRRQFLYGAFSLAFAAYYYRNYVGIYSMYKDVYGGRAVVVPNLKIKG